MRVVVENSEADLARPRALAQVSWAILALTANLLRATRGAGRAYEINQQAAKLLEAMEQYREAIGHYPHRLRAERGLVPARP